MAPTDDSLRVLQSWREREAELRSRMKDVGVIEPQRLRALSGMELFAAIFAGELPYPPIGATVDMLPVEIQPGSATFQGQPMLRHYNPIGTVHGGWIATLLDSCLGCAVHSALPAGKGYTTVELKVNYVRAVTTRVPLVRAVGQIIHVGARLATADGRLVGPDGKLYAHASTTCMVFDHP